MAHGDELRISAALLKALEFAPEEGAEPTAEAVLAACLLRLALETGLAEREDPGFNWLEHAGIPRAALGLLIHFMGNQATSLSDDEVRNGLYDALLAIAGDARALKAVDKSRSMSGNDLLMFAQIYWNLEADRRRPQLPIRSGLQLSNGLLARIKTPYEDRDLAALELSNRAARTPGYTNSGGAFYARGARIAVLAARRIASLKEVPALGGARFRSTESGRGTEWSIVWPTVQTVVAPTDGIGGVLGASAKPLSRYPVASPSGNLGGGTRVGLTLESAIAATADRVGTLPDLRLVTARAGTVDPARFLSGASLNAAEVGEYAVPRRVDMDGDEIGVEEVSSRIAAEESVGYLIAGPGEGKSTYLHTLCSSLTSRGIVFRWSVTHRLDWSWLQTFRDLVASAMANGTSSEPPILIVGELATRLTRKQEDALIEIVQGIPSGLAPTRTSILVAGRPAWLGRLRQRVSTGQTMRLMPLSDAEAELLVDKLADAYLASCQNKGPAWTDAQLPNLSRFLALPRESQVAVFLRKPSLVGSLLQAAYGREFLRRLTAEYADLGPAERTAYLLVSLATSSLGGISEELLETICPDANISECSAGTPWQRDADGMHSARHEMIGRIIVEDRGASTARDISQTTGKILDAAISSPEARRLLLNSVRIFDESRSLVPTQQRKTEPQFRAAIRSGIVEHRESWERLEQSIRPEPGQFLEYSYVLHRMLPETLGRGEANEYLLSRIEHLLALAESNSLPGSPLASQARAHRIFVERNARRIRGDIVDDLGDFRQLQPMLAHSWPDASFYAQFLSLGLSTLKHCDVDADEADQVAGAVLEAWQRLRVEGNEGGLVYGYSAFVARDLFNLPKSRRLRLLETAWEFSHAIANPDGALACLLDEELSDLGSSGLADDADAPRARRRRILKESLVAGQGNSEVALRFALLPPTDSQSDRHIVERACRQLATADNPTTRSMALHALAIVASSDDDRLDYLRSALPAYDQSMTSRDDWLTRGPFWKRALRELRGIAPDEVDAYEAQIASAGRRFRI